MRGRLERLKAIDIDTGELKNILIRTEVRTRGGRFMKIFFDGLRFADETKLHGQSAKVLIVLMRRVTYHNKVPRVTDMAKSLGIKQPAISKAYKELVIAGFLVSKDRDYYLNPSIFWNGGEKTQEQAIRELVPIPKPTIAPPVLMVCEPRAKYR